MHAERRQDERRRVAVASILAVALTAAMVQRVRSDQGEMGVSLKGSKEQVVSCDPVELTLVIQNLSDREIAVLSPELEPKTVVPAIRDQVTGNQIRPHVKWAAPRINDRVTVAPGGSYGWPFQLEELFPLGMPPGSYEMSFRYTPDYENWVETNTIKLEVKPLSADDSAQLEQAIKVLQSAERKDVIERATRFLNRQKEGRFVSLVRLELAENYLALGDYSEAETVLRKVLADRSTTVYERRQANWRMAHVFRARGETEGGIEYLKKAGTRHAARLAEAWSHEKAASEPSGE